MTPTYRIVKRGVDLLGATVGLAVLSPVMIAAAIAVKATSAGPVFFMHERVGRKGRRFHVIKFRSMATRDSDGPQLTSAGDARITPVGEVLRRFKIDELPQLFNVLRGEMSLVGPRPEVAKYVELFPHEYELILGVRPGLTDYAAIAFRDEERILAASADPEAFYVADVLPRKIELYKQYLGEASLGVDARLILQTLVALAR